MDMLFENPLPLFGLALVGMIGVAVFAWHFWGESIQKKLRGTEKMPVLVWKREPKVEVDKLEIESTRYLVDHKSRRSWLFDSQAITYNTAGQPVGVLINNDSCIPHYAGSPEKLLKVCESLDKNGPYLWRSRCLADIEKMQREQSSNSVAEWLGISALAIVLGALILGGIIIIPQVKDML